MIDLKLLRTLQALQQTGSLQAAASRLFLTQSALSHQLKDAETQLDCSLFIRKTQPVQFSSQGKLLLQLAEQVLPLVDATALQLKTGANTSSNPAAHGRVSCLLSLVAASRESFSRTMACRHAQSGY